MREISGWCPCLCTVSAAEKPISFGGVGCLGEKTPVLLSRSHGLSFNRPLLSFCLNPTDVTV